MTTGHFEDDKIGGGKFVPHVESQDDATARIEQSGAEQDHIDAEQSQQVVTIRDRDGKPYEAQYIRQLSIKGLEKFHLALTLWQGWYSVSELSSGACIWNESQDMHLALQYAKRQLLNHTPKQFASAVSGIIAKYGKLDGTIKTVKGEVK